MSRAETSGGNLQKIIEYFSLDERTKLPLLRLFQGAVLKAIGGKDVLKNIEVFPGGEGYGPAETGYREYFHDFVAGIPTFSEFLRAQVRNQHLTAQAEGRASLEFRLDEVLAVSDRARIKELDEVVQQLRALGSSRPESINLNEVRALVVKACVLMFGDEFGDHFKQMFGVSGEFDIKKGERPEAAGSFQPSRHLDTRARWLSHLQIIPTTGICADVINQLQIAVNPWSLDDASEFQAYAGYSGGEKGFRQMLKAKLQLMPTYTEFMREKIQEFPEISLYDVLTLDNTEAVRRLDEICLRLRAMGDLPEERIDFQELRDLYNRADAIIYGKS